MHIIFFIVIVLNVDIKMSRKRRFSDDGLGSPLSAFEKKEKLECPATFQCVGYNAGNTYNGYQHKTL